MNAKEAREIIYKYNHFAQVIRDPNLKTREDRITEEFLQAESYLAALEGPEVKALVEALEFSLKHCPGEYPIDFEMRDKMEKALAAYKQAVGKGRKKK